MNHTDTDTATATTEPDEVRLPVSLRDYFAAKAMQAIAPRGGLYTIADSAVLAEMAFMLADAMIAERKKARPS